MNLDNNIGEEEVMVLEVIINNLLQVKDMLMRYKGVPNTCHKCGQDRHMAIGCRVRTDFQRRLLNYKKSTARYEELAQGRTNPGYRY